MERIVPIGGTIGILGGGQLGRMMAIAGREMGLHTVVWDPQAGGPASEASDGEVAAAYHDSRAFERFVDQVDCVTYEFENVDLELAESLERHRRVSPAPELLRVSRNRLREKERARQFGCATTAFARVGQVNDLEEAVATLGVPGILKTTEGGYDGKGQLRIDLETDLAKAYHVLALEGQELIYEQMVSFSQEVSVVVARSLEGRIETFPVTENHHNRGILDLSIVPAEVSSEAIEEALYAARVMAEGLGLVGVMALEFFVTDNGQVLFNEMAPRPHNSGHWTIDGASISQFSQHMRAVAGYDIEKPQLLSCAVMMNLLGELFEAGLGRLPEVLAIPGVHLHWYGKTVMKPGRKVGHLTILAQTRQEALESARKAKEILGGEWTYGA